ncbi:ankyrin 2,3/unc44 [Achlya hypogyna]|uniref:Ankyrin 2,3/unc44 n=1 Tax=Achlya hypogyna TaxID=1202772 RepID=A0A1V9Y6C0_ACHHY|nr:ankyrin 2,3/unc44 [Achlya hypogyna]
MVQLLERGHIVKVFERLSTNTYTSEDLHAISGNNTVLSKACEMGLLEMTKLILETTTYTKIPEYKVRPLECAVCANQVAITRLLLDTIPDIDVATNFNNGNTALHCAARRGHTDVLAMLLQVAPNIDLTNEDGLSPLHEAVAGCRRKCVELLISVGANVNSQTKTMATPLHTAIDAVGQESEASMLRVVDLLLCANASIDIPNQDGITALDYARTRRILQILKREATTRASFPEHILVRNGRGHQVGTWIAQFFEDAFEYHIWNGGLAPLRVKVFPDAGYSQYQIVGQARDETESFQIVGHWIGDRITLTKVFPKRTVTFEGVINVATGAWMGLRASTPMQCCVTLWPCIVCTTVKVPNEGAACLSCLKQDNDSSLEDITHAAVQAQRAVIQAAADKITAALSKRESDGQTVVMHAAKFGRFGILQRLLPYCSVALLQTKDNEGQTVLDLAIANTFLCVKKAPSDANGDLLNIVNELCHRGNMTIDPSSIPLRQANGDLRVQCCGDMQPQGAGHNDALAAIASEKKWAELLTVLQSVPADQKMVDDSCASGKRVLQLVCENGRDEILGILLTQPTLNVDVALPEDEIMLYTAAKHGRTKCVKLLLLAGADPMFDESFWNESAKWPYPGCKHLIAAKRELRNVLPLYYIANVPNSSTADAYAEAKHTPLHAAVTNRQLPKVVLRLTGRSNVDIDAKDAAGKTALMYAAEMGQAKTVDILLDQHAKVDTKNDHEYTALSLATLNGHTAIVKTLLEHFADIDVIHSDGKSLLDTLEAKIRTAKKDKDALQQIHAMLLDEDQVRGTPEYLALLSAKLVSIPTEDAFGKHGFAKAINCSPALGRMFLNDCVQLNRHDITFHQLEHVYGKEVKKSALNAILHLRTANPELLVEAKTECLEHVVMVRLLQIKWELFGERKYIEQLLMNLLLLITMTTSSLMFDESSVAANTIPMVLGTFVFVNTIVGYGAVQCLRPVMLWRLARFCYEGNIAFDPRYPIPHLPKHKKKAKLLVAGAGLGLSVVIVVPLVLVLIFTGLARYFPACNHVVLWFTSLYFVATEVEEMTSGWTLYWKSRINRTQLCTNVAILLVFVPMKLEIVPAPWPVQTGVGGAITIVLWILSLQFLEVVPAAGYLLPMMSKLLADVGNFFIFFGVFQMGLTITFYQLFRNQDAEAFNTLGQSFITTYFVAFGQLPLDSITSFDAHDPYDQFLSTCTVLLMMFHSAVVIVLLLNVLLAMMNKTVDGGLEKAKTEALASYASCILRLEEAMGLDAVQTDALIHFDLGKDGQVLNPIFSEVVPKAALVLSAAQADAIRRDNAQKRVWLDVVESVETLLNAELERLEAKLTRVEHFGPPGVVAGFDSERHLLATARAHITKHIAAARRHRGEDAVGELEKLQVRVLATVQELCTNISENWSPVNAVQPLDLHGRCVVIYHLVHGENVGLTLLMLQKRIEMNLKAIEVKPLKESADDDESLLPRFQAWKEEQAVEAKKAREGQTQAVARLESRLSMLETTMSSVQSQLTEALTILRQHGGSSPRRTQSFPVVDPRHLEQDDVHRHPL